MLKQSLIWIMLLFLALLPGMGRAQPVVDGVVMAAWSEYGLAWHFTLVAQSEVRIEQAHLFAAAPGLPFTYTDRLSVQDTAVDLVYTLPLDTIRPAPFTLVTYWWELETGSGERIILPTATFSYEDNRFTWHYETAGALQVAWTGSPTGFPAAAVLALARESQESLSQIIPVTLPESLTLYVYPSSSDLRSALRLAGRDWQAGHAGPDLGVLLLVAVNPRTAEADLAQAIPQAMGRLFLYQAAAEQYETLPRWLKEGVAGVVPGANGGAKEVVQRAAANQSLLSLADLCATWPADLSQTQLAAAQSMTLAHWLQQQFGNLALNRLVHAYRNGQSCADGLSYITNMPLETVNQQWQGHLSQQNRWLTAVQQNGLWILLLLAGFVLTAILLLSYWPRPS